MQAELKEYFLKDNGGGVFEAYEHDEWCWVHKRSKARPRVEAFRVVTICHSHVTPCHAVTRDAADSVQLSSSWQVWQDALDLTQSGGTGEVKCLFHYTGQLGFRNITAPSKKAVEVFVLDSVTTHHVVCLPPTHPPSHKLLDDPKASLVTEGPKANAWWGQGKFSSSRPPTMVHHNGQSMVELVRAPFATMEPKHSFTFCDGPCPCSTFVHHWHF